MTLSLDRSGPCHPWHDLHIGALSRSILLPVDAAPVAKPVLSHQAPPRRLAMLG